MWFLVYLIIGMVYSGFTFTKLYKFVLEHAGMTREEFINVKNENANKETQSKVTASFIVAVVVSVMKIFLYPFFLTAPLGRKLAKVVK